MNIDVGPLLTIGAGVGLVLIGAFVAVGKSYDDGYLRDYLDERERSKQVGDEAHEQVIEKLDKVDKLDDIEEIVKSAKEQAERNGQRIDCIDEKVESIGESVFILHQDDEDVDEEALREHVAVDSLAQDIVEGD